jgi:hypothetical protein
MENPFEFHPTQRPQQGVSSEASAHIPTREEWHDRYPHAPYPFALQQPAEPEPEQAPLTNVELRKLRALMNRYFQHDVAEV